MRHSLAIARKDFRDIFRERTIVLALLLQLFIAAFSSFLLVGLVGLYDPARAESQLDHRVAYVGPGPFGEHLRSQSSLDVLITDATAAKRLFDQGRVDAIVEEMYDEADGIRTINLLLPEGEIPTTLLVTLLKDHMKDYERVLRGEREAEIVATVVYVAPPDRPNPYYAFGYALLVPLLLIVPTFLSGAIAADAITQEVETRTLELLRSSPASARSILTGKIIAPILIAPLQGLLWLGLLTLNGIAIANPLPILVLLAAITVPLVCAAVLFGLALRKPGDAQVAYSLFVLVLLAAAQLLPQPLLAAFARLAAGSFTLLELSTLAGAVGFALVAFAIARALAPRLLRRAA